MSAKLTNEQKVETGWVPAGWSPANWVKRLRTLADLCEELHPDLAAQHREHARNVERAQATVDHAAPAFVQTAAKPKPAIVRY